MFSFKLPYRFLLAFMTFFFILAVPFGVFIYQDYEVMKERLDWIEPLTPEQETIFQVHFEGMLDNVLVLSFYIFILAFIFSLFFAKSVMAPAKELYGAVHDIAEGKFESRLEVTANDEMGSVTRAFNRMADFVQRQDYELRMKSHYLNVMVDPMWVVDDNNRITDVNPAFSRLLGYGREAIVGFSLFDFFEEEDEKVVRRKLFERNTGAFSMHEVSIISKTEGLVPVLFSSSPIIEGGETVGRIGMFRDFRREAALRDALKEERADAEAIIESMVDQLLVVDRDFRILKANMAAKVDTGRQLVGEFCNEIFHLGPGRCYQKKRDCPVKIVFDTGKPYQTVRGHLDGGKTLYTQIIAYPVKDRDGNVKHSVLSMMDITERKKFEAEIAEKNRELTALNSISKVLSQSLNAEDIFHKVLDKLIELTGMEGGGIFLLDELHRDLRCKFFRGVSEDFIKSTGFIKLGEGVPGRVALTGNPFVTSDVSTDERAVRSSLRHSGIKGYACFPIRGKEKLIGVFFVFSFSSHFFTSEEKRTFHSMSEMLGISFENIRLYEKMRELYEQNRKRRAEEQKNLLALSSMMADTLDMKKVLASSVSLIRKTCLADFVWLLGTVEEGLVLRSASENGFFDGEIVYVGRRNSIEHWAIQKKEPVTAKGIDSRRTFRIDARLRKFSAACSIPVFIGERTLGAFTLYFSAPRELQEEEVHFLQTVGSVLAVALERTRLYENVIIQRGMADTILESITDGVVTVNRNGVVISMNSAAGNIIGFPAESAVGTELGTLLGRPAGNVELGLKVQDCLEQAAEGGVASGEANFVAVDGRRLPLVFRSAPVYDNKGGIAGVVYVMRDLSMERELDMLKTDFVRSVSHEFRTPLTAIVGMTEMVLDGEVDPGKTRDYLTTVLSEASRLSRMVTDVLDLAKIERGKEIFTEGEVDFNVLLRDIRETYESAFEKKNVKYAVHFSGKSERFKGDANRLKQLLQNLIENSLTYSDEGCSVEVRVRERNGKVRISVSDSGWGMGEDELQHVGEKFYRGKSAGRTKGTGLGLSLCKEIARAHGGRLKVKSEKGKGTTITVELPERRN